MRTFQTPLIRLGVQLFLVTFGVMAGSLNAAARPSGEDLAQAVHSRDVGSDSFSRQVMELISADGQKRLRELEISAMDKGGLRKSLLRFTSPADIAGTGFLALENDQGETEQFLYLPALKRTRRIVTGQKGRSFVNTDFTYEDMERRPVEDSEHIVTGEADLSGVKCWLLESRPKPGSDSQYSLVRAWVSQDHSVILKADFFTDGIDPIKRYTVLQLENIQGIWTEKKVSMEDLESGHKTLLEIREITYNSGIPESVFSQQSLESW
jgi:hypothetical protein